MTAPPAAAIEVRRLTYADLPQVVAIERRAFPTPWSLAMFVLELSKASGICLAAFVDGELAGYLVCSRYDTVWHIMNVSVDPDRRRHGIASTLLTRLFERVDDPEAHYTLEVRRSNEGAIALYDRFRFRSAGPAAALLRRQRRGRGRDVAHAGDAARLARRRAERRADLILALETSCDDTCAAVVTDAGEVLLVGRLLAGRPRPLRRRRAGDRVAPSPRARQRGRRRRAAPGGARLDDVSLVAVTQGPGLVGALLVGVATAKGLAAARRLPLAPVDHLQGHVAANFLAPDADRAAVPVPDRVRRPHAARARDRPPRLRGARADARRRRRRGVRQGRAAARARLSGRAGAVAARARAAIRPRSRSRPRRGSRGSTSRSPGLKTALLYAVRDLGEEETRRRAADLAASYEHAIVEALIAADRARAGGRAGRAARDRRRRRGEPAAARARRGARRRGQGAAAGAVHRQRGDDRLRRPLGRARPVPGLPRPRRLRDRPPQPRRLSRGRASARAGCAPRRLRAAARRRVRAQPRERLADRRGARVDRAPSSRVVLLGGQAARRRRPRSPTRCRSTGAPRASRAARARA